MKKFIIPFAVTVFSGFTSLAHTTNLNTQDTLIIKSGDSTRVIVENLDELKNMMEDFVGLFEDWDETPNPRFQKKHIIPVEPPKPQYKRFSVSSLMMDVGFNGFVDNTNYQTAETANFLRVAPEKRNSNYMGIKTWSSRNFNIWPVLLNFNTVKSNNQNLFLSTGVGFQFYNFKFINDEVKINGGTDPYIGESNLYLTKNKLGITYLSIPLLLTGQTRVSNHYWLTYGVGLIGSYRICTWTNQKSPESGKQKQKDNFNMEDFGYAVTGEIGVKNILRLYATYQLTNMWKDGLYQQPFALGVRFFGI